MTLTHERFDEFFRAVYGKEDDPDFGPFRWQGRLLDHLLADGRWPEVIAAPTGAGKTSVIDVHVYAVALTAIGDAPRLPRRLSMVVDRRVLVDDQYEHASTLSALLRKARHGVLAEVATVLKSLHVADDPDGAADTDGRLAEPLLVTRLRGGVPVPRVWRDDPVACQVICATPDMWGSRLLMAGYGSSAAARPREAGLLAYDSAVVVDEAHLSRQLIQTARRVADLAGLADRPLDVPVLQVVEATATPDLDADTTRVGVEPEDLEADPVLAERLCRPKPVELLELPTRSPSPGASGKPAVLKAMAERTVRLREEYGSTIGCFVNNVSTALDLAKRLGPLGRTQLVCGRLRPYDLEKLREDHPYLLRPEGDPDVDFLISTQSLEVGADFSLRAALVELAPGSSIAQRAGRVNRRGEHADTRVVVAVPGEGFDDKAVVLPYETADLKDALNWLRERAADQQGLAPWALREHPAPGREPRRTLLQRPELSDAWQWSRTSDDLFDRPDLELWLSDDLKADLDVGIVIRRDMPSNAAAAIQLIDALPPMDYEAIPVRITIARDRLEKLTTIAVIVRDDDTSTFSPEALRPGDIVVIGTDAVIFTKSGDMALVDATGHDATTDVLEAPRSPKAGQYVFRLDSHPDDKSELGTAITHAVSTAAALHSAEALQTRNGRNELAESLDKLAILLDDEQATRATMAIEVLRTSRTSKSGKPGKLKDFDVEWLDIAAGKLIITDNRRMAGDESIRQQWSPAGQVTLHDHSAAVADRASRLAGRLDLGPLTGLLKLAGLHHDDGKADPRFQLCLDPDGASDVPLAKSSMTTRKQVREAFARSGLPRGWRHEQLSVLASQDDLAALPPADRDLVARLIGTSHGFGRHGFPHSMSELTGDPAYGDTGGALFDEGLWDYLIETTHRAFGVWGCAYLEAVLRAADGQISREGS